MDKLSKRPDETDLAYHKRLIYGKLVDGTLADEDYSELSPYVYGKEYNTDTARRMMYGSCRTLQILDDASREGFVSENPISEIDSKMLELKKERQKLSDQRIALNKIIRDRARQEELHEVLLEAVSNGDLPSLDYHPSYIGPSDNDLLVSLNDIHYGANVDNYWNHYDSDICKQMMRRYIDQIISIGRTHGSENCIVWANGDMISGNIHNSIAVTNKENVIEQITGVSELIAEFLAELSKHFASVRYVSVAGNHSRIDVRERALKDERLDDLVEWYLSARLQQHENIVFGHCEKVDSTMYLIDIRGKVYCGVHGDYDGSASKAQTLQTMARRPLYAVLSGHLHHNRIDCVQGVRTVMAGSFLGMDDYCVTKRIYGEPQQLVCVCDTNGIRCFYDVNLQ